MKKGPMHIYLWALGLFVVLFLSACAQEETTEEVLRPVKHVTVGSAAGAIRNRVFSGTAHSAEEADLSFKVSGTVIEVAVEVGDEVKRGDLIAELDSDTYAVELEQAMAAMAQTNATRRSAESEYQRVRQLYTNDNASKNELDEALASAESAKAAFNADEQSVRLARLNLGYTKLRVDADCSVAEVSVENNENVSSGQTVAQVSCGESWEIRISVPETLIALFEDGMAGTAQFSALQGESFPGVVTEVGVGTGTSSTFPVTLTLDEVPSIIRSNLAAEVTFQFSNQNNADSSLVYLPASAVVQDQAGLFVYVMEPADQPDAAMLMRRNVEVGEISELGLEILSGLEAGDRVLTAGHINVREGLLVRDK